VLLKLCVLLLRHLVVKFAEALLLPCLGWLSMLEKLNIETMHNNIINQTGKLGTPPLFLKISLLFSSCPME